jgi:hypothetical protein
MTEWANYDIDGKRVPSDHAIDQPDLRKTFKSFSQMHRWFTEHAAGAKGKTR